MNQLIIVLFFLLNLMSQNQFDISVALKNQLISNQFNSDKHVNSIIEFSYINSNWYFGFSYQSNSDYRFKILPEPIELISPDITNIINLDDVTFNPDRYIISNEFSVTTGLKFDGVAIDLQFYKISESNSLESIIINGNSLFVRNNTVDNDRYFTDLDLRFNLQNIDFFAGLKQIKLSGLLQSDLLYQFDLSSYPFIGLSYHDSEYRFSSTYDEFSLKFSALKKLKILPLEFSTAITLGHKSDFTQFLTQINYQFSSEFSMTATYQRSDNHIPIFKRATFLKQIETSYLQNLINDSRITVGLTYNYETASFRDQLVFDVAMKNEAIYLAKQSLYEHDPYGTIILFNTGESELHFYIEVKSEDNFINYKSEFFTLFGGDTLTVPLFIFMNTADITARSQQKQLEVNLISDSENERLFNKTIHLFDRNFWSGVPGDLVYYLQSNNRLVRDYAAQIYRNITVSDSNYYQKRFLKLKQFINEISYDKQYVTDPVRSILVDEVQYPDELLKQKIGDCEDLLVFYMSALMSIGNQCAIIALKPKENETVGHVFLLLDTGIPVSYQNRLNLTDIGTVKRQNYLGEYTLWIPLEVTILNQGFESAYKDGIRQYYDELIVKEGIQNHTVQVIDTY